MGNGALRNCLSDSEDVLAIESMISNLTYRNDREGRILSFSSTCITQLDRQHELAQRRSRQSGTESRPRCRRCWTGRVRLPVCRSCLRVKAETYRLTKHNLQEITGTRRVKASEACRRSLLEAAEERTRRIGEDSACLLPLASRVQAAQAKCLRQDEEASTPASEEVASSVRRSSLYLAHPDTFAQVSTSCISQVEEAKSREGAYCPQVLSVICTSLTLHTARLGKRV